MTTQNQQLFVLTADGRRVPLPPPPSFDEISDDEYAQSFQWTMLLRVWPAIAILAGVSAVMCAFIFQTVLAIINAGVFFIAFGCFIVGAFRYYILLVFLLLFVFAGFLFETFYVVALLADFYRCASSSCLGWRIYLYDINYYFIVLLDGVLLLIARLCWTMLADHREITTIRLSRLSGSSEKDKLM